MTAENNIICILFFKISVKSINIIIAVIRYRTNSKAPAFNGLWMRLGQNYLDSTKYHSAVFFPLKDGKTTPIQKLYKGSPVLTFKPTELTVQESKDAFSFLFTKEQNTAGYNAAKKLKTFVDSITTKEYKHNVLFIEKEDVADVTKARNELKLSNIVAKLSDYELKNNLVKETPKAEEKITNESPTAAQLMQFLSENGVA